MDNHERTLSFNANLDQIARVEPRVGAWTYFDQAQAAAQFQAIETFNSPLSGLPVGLKDIIDTADMPTENGTILDKGRQPEADAVLVSRLKSAGAVIMGKTVTTELAYFHPGKTSNPHDQTRSPGGSSSGSAAAVASGMVPVAIGTQTTGSVIRPASFCGVIGYKPTLGLIPLDGVLLQSHTLDTVGVFANSVQDAADLTSCLSDTEMKVGRLVSSPRFAFLRSPSWDLADPATQSTFETFAVQLGDQCVAVDLPPEFNDARAVHRTINMVELANNYGAYERRGRDKLSTRMCEAIDEGRSIPDADYKAALINRQELIELLEPIFDEHDVILTPATLGEAPVGLETTGDPAFCAIWSLCGLPAISLPLLTGPAGMPLGVQLVSPRNRDTCLLADARWLMENAPA